MPYSTDTLTINVMLFIWRGTYVMVLRRATSITRGTRRVGPWKSRLFFRPWNGYERIECHLGLKKVNKHFKYGLLNLVTFPNYGKVIKRNIILYCSVHSRRFGRGAQCCGPWILTHSICAAIQVPQPQEVNLRLLSKFFYNCWQNSVYLVPVFVSCISHI